MAKIHMGVRVAEAKKPGILVGYAAPRQCQYGVGYSTYLTNSWKLPDGRVIEGTEEAPLALTLEAGDNFLVVPMNPATDRKVPEGKIASTHTVLFHPDNMDEFIASLTKGA